MQKTGSRAGRRGAASILAGALPAGLLLPALLLGGGLSAAGCGGGGGPSPKKPEDALLYVLSFSLPNYSGVFLDEDVIFQFSAPVNEGTINPDSIQIRTGPTGGVAPFGFFVRGTFLVDPSTGNRVVVDGEGITENGVRRVERAGDLSKKGVDDTIRIDLGFDTAIAGNGIRRPLFDRSRRSTVTFIPEVPTRAALDDTGYLPASTYTVAVPGYPSTNTLENLAGAQLISPENRVFTSSFTTVPLTAGKVFLGAESAGAPRIIHSDPYNGDILVPVTDTIAIRFSQPLDPRTVTQDQFVVEQVTVATKVVSVPAGNVNAATDTFTSANHGFGNNQKVQVTTNGSLPGGVQPSTDYYIVGVTTNTFQISATPGGAAVDVTSQGTGTHDFTNVTPNNVPLAVSVFLAQQRLGKVEVILTPINPLPGDATIRVTVKDGIEDLLGQSMNTSVISFFTGVGKPPNFGPITQDFIDNNKEDAGQTTANWNGVKPFVGATPGALTASYAPYAGDGSDGAFLAPVGQTTVLDTGTSQHRVYNFTTFTIPIGARVRAQGNFPLVVHCQEDVIISDELDARGSDGGLALPGTNPSDTTGSGGAGGTAGPGGGNGGAGAFAVVGGGGNFDGVNGQGPGAGKGGFTGENDSIATGGFFPRLRADGNPQSNGQGGTCGDAPNDPEKSFAPCRIREGGGGGGYAQDGADSDNNGATELSRDGATVPNGGDGGPSWGSATMANASTSATVQVKDTTSGGLKTIVLNGIPTLVALQGGSGGGGGGGEDDMDGSGNNGTSDGGDDGGGGGGGGGGAVQITSFKNITVNGKILCDGGNGGNSALDIAQSDFWEGAGGGGGSGGTIWLQCRGQVTVDPLAQISVLGGLGGVGYADGTSVLHYGGDGAEGRIRIEDANGSVTNAPAAASVGTFTPALDLDSVAWSVWENLQFSTPDYLSVAVDAATNGAGNSIKVYLEGAPEDVTTVVDDPDETKSTGLVLVYDSTQGGLIAGNPHDLLDLNKFFRFKVEFHVDASHPFASPLPTVDSVTVDIGL